MALEIHKIVADLEKYPNQINESYIVAKSEHDERL